MMTVGCITLWNDFGKSMTKNDKITANCNMCPLQMLHSEAVTFFVTCNCSTCCWSSSVILKMPENPKSLQSFIKLQSVRSKILHLMDEDRSKIEKKNFNHIPDLNKYWMVSRHIMHSEDLECNRISFYN